MHIFHEVVVNEVSTIFLFSSIWRGWSSRLSRESYVMKLPGPKPVLEDLFAGLFIAVYRRICSRRLALMIVYSSL